MESEDYQPPNKLTFARVVKSVVLAAGVAAGIVALYHLFQVYVGNNWGPLRHYDLSNVAVTYIAAFFVWLLGLSVFGGPVWGFLHTTERTAWPYAVVAGFIVPFVVVMALSTRFFTGQATGHFSSYANGGQQWVDGTMTAFGWFIAIRTSALIGAIGACLGLLIWFTAYRRG